MAKISDVVKLKSGYANFVELKSAFEAAQENADRMAMSCLLTLSSEIGSDAPGTFTFESGKM
jgi:hypothetical protein